MSSLFGSATFGTMHTITSVLKIFMGPITIVGLMVISKCAIYTIWDPFDPHCTLKVQLAGTFPANGTVSRGKAADESENLAHLPLGLYLSFGTRPVIHKLYAF